MAKDKPPERSELLEILRQQPRGSANRQRQQVEALIEALERDQPADLSDPITLQQLEGVWELRWSSSQQPYLSVAPWLENLQGLAPSQGRGVNLLRLVGPLASIAGIAVEAEIALDPGQSQRVRVSFRRGGWVGPSLGGKRLQWLQNVKQSFPAWLDITVVDQDLRICRGNAGTVFALLRRPDLELDQLL
ncbi:PAP/fibrillin family protein [Synechococcus sp. W4D4]|uniref:PAP/fibrillin family protein n=1 Tax=Synechococcus sp. W4D4 TaxID=3392294 RepID=UPI0039EB7B88